MTAVVIDFEKARARLETRRMARRLAAYGIEPRRAGVLAVMAYCMVNAPPADP